MAAPAQTVELAVRSGLVYVNDNEMPGITRKRVGKGFAYYGPDGNLIKDQGQLKRIRSLAIPPAYTSVWICPLADGHIQATGRDARGRKQYRYHPKWIELTNETKFNRMLSFGSKLPEIRRRIEADLSKRGLSREKVLAAVLWLLDKSLIRVGNEEYARENKSYGLTTMLGRHVTAGSTQVEFRFKGKRGIQHLIKVSDRRMARIIKSLQELPGQYLFHYIDEEGGIQKVDSDDVNAYLREISGEEFTAKDFRTWAATVIALAQLAGCCGFETKKEANAGLKAALTTVASQLGNTPAIARKSYVHPSVMESYSSGALSRFLKSRIDESNAEPTPIEDCAEGMVLELLQTQAADDVRKAA